MLIAPFSAIPSWEGFEYQRHIGLYIALKHIWHEVELGNEGEVNLYQLGIEGAEDFSIIKGDSYVSLHQVKEGAIDLKDNDKACFILSVLQYEVQNAYFHIVPNANIFFDFLEKTIQSIDCLLTELNKEIKTKKEFNDEITVLETTHGREIKKSDTLYKQTEDKFILINKINSKASKGSLYSILNCNCDGNKEKENVIKAILSARNELSTYKEQLKRKSDSDIWNVYEERFETPANVISNSCQIIEKISS